MQHELILGYISRGDEEEHWLRQPYDSLSQRDPWRPPETRSGGLMVFDHKGRLVKADTCAERILAAIGVELTRDPRLRIDALDTTDAKPQGDSQLPGWLDPEWIEAIIEGNERLGTVVQIPDRARSASPVQGGLPVYKLRQAVEFIEAHFDRPITLARLAAAVYLSLFEFVCCGDWRLAKLIYQSARLRIATRCLHLKERAEQRRPPLLEVAVSL